MIRIDLKRDQRFAVWSSKYNGHIRIPNELYTIQLEFSILWVWVYGYTYLYYCSLTKEHPWVEHLTSLPKRGVDPLLSVFTFNHERAPIYAYSDSLPSNLLKYWTNTNTQRSCWPLNLKLWWHATLWMANYHSEHGVANKSSLISRLRCKTNLW